MNLKPTSKLSTTWALKWRAIRVTKLVVTSVRTTSHDVFANELWDNGGPLGTTQVNSLPNLATPVALPATAGLYSNLIAWQQNPGSAGLAEIRSLANKHTGRVTSKSR